MINPEDFTLFNQIKSKLSSKGWKVLVQRYLYGYTQDEVAENLSVSRSTIARIERSTRKLIQ